MYETEIEIDRLPIFLVGSCNAKFFLVVIGSRKAIQR